MKIQSGTLWLPSSSLVKQLMTQAASSKVPTLFGYLYIIVAVIKDLDSVCQK